MDILRRTITKEFGTFFSSPIAFLFIGSFLAITLFVFFWVETFFVRNIAEIRALFEWMPLLLIFLCAAITMRMWAEEHRAGTLEFLLTSPVKPLTLVMGKFLACLGLVGLSLLLTLPLPLTVSLLGQLDWGPVWSGYLATLFLAAAYLAVGLYVSINSENQIISLIVTALICSLFYLIGSDTLVAFLGNKGSEIMQLLGSGSRFESITRGVIDGRDLYYYLSIMAVFLCLNVYGLEKIRWAGNPTNRSHTRWRLACGLIIANVVAANFWLAQIPGLRGDMTQRNIYSISDSTRSYLQMVKEPLLIRGYFSPQTHPLLAPLVPRIRDLLKEYGVAGGDKVQVEFVDPLEDPELEREAGQKYGIRPIPFQTSSKYQASITNSYFDILIQYGDQFETLGFRDLIEIKAANEQSLDVELRNPEYDITKAIKKVLYSYQGGGDIFAGISKPITFTGYFSADALLPQELVKLKNDLLEKAASLKERSGGKLTFTVLDPDENGGAIAEKLQTDYGFRPMSASLFDMNTFWFYMTLDSGDQVVEIPLPEELDMESLQRSLNDGLKRFDTGYTQTVALSVPAATPPMPQYGMMAPSGLQFTTLRTVLSQEHGITDANLTDGSVSNDADLLMVVSPESVDEKELFAMDQFLMQGGTLVLASSSFNPSLQGALSVTEHNSGLEEWLAHHGITIDGSMVMDSQNSPFPVPVERNIQGFTVRETHMVNYPYFVDIRLGGMNQDHSILSGLQQLTLNWASPIVVDEEKNAERKVTRLLESSDQSWLSSTLEVQPDFERYGDAGFPITGEQSSHLLGVSIEGSFTSYFAGKESPLQQAPTDEKTEVDAAETDEGEKVEEKQVILRQLDKSPDSARIILFSSNSFLSDTALGISSSVMQTTYLEPIQLVANSVDWALEDSGLLQIRGRSHFSRPLLPLTKDMQLFWEYLNYGLAVVGLVILWGLKTVLQKRTSKKQLELLFSTAGRQS